MFGTISSSSEVIVMFLFFVLCNSCSLVDTSDKASATWTKWQHITQPEQSSEQASVMQHKVQKPNDNIWWQTNSLKQFSLVILGFCCEVAENCTLLGYYVESSGNFLPAFWDNLSVPSSEFKNSKENP